MRHSESSLDSAALPNLCCDTRERKRGVFSVTKPRTMQTDRHSTCACQFPLASGHWHCLPPSRVRKAVRPAGQALTTVPGTFCAKKGRLCGTRCSAAYAEEPQSQGSLDGTPAEAKRVIQDSSTNNGSILSEDFCIIESRDSVKDFAALQIDEITAGIQSRRNKIFLLMEEVRRLRIQQRLKGGEKSREEEVAQEQYQAVVPLLPARTDASMKEYWRFYLTSVSMIILFGGLLAPILEVKMGLGGTTYADFIRNMHLPGQLAAVDPIVASFCGGAVGVLTTLLLVEVNNSDNQARNRCIYCGGTGYVTCGSCSGEGTLSAAESSERCATCSGTGKVMCTGCLCTGKKVAHEHDPRLDPFF